MVIISPIRYFWFKTYTRIRRSLRKIRALLYGTVISDENLIRSLGGQFESLEIFINHINNRQTPKFFVIAPSIESKQELINHFPKIEILTISAAENVLNHKFDILGSGPTYLGEKINWHLDFKTGYLWNSRTYFSDVKWASYPGGFDIKVPWELSRFQHVIWLGQAYWFTGDEKYTVEFISQIRDWIENNHFPYGVNWSSTMDVSIRVINWIWGYYFFRQSNKLTYEFMLGFVKALILHGNHILANLEVYHSLKGSIKNNHFISNLVALVYLGIFLPEIKFAKEWLNVGLHGLEQEISMQTLIDGVDFESSTSYHRLVTELFISACLLSMINGIDLSKQFMIRLEMMIEYVYHMIKPDGTTPLIGDNDNGRVHRLKVWESPEQEWIDFRYILAIGAVLFNREDFAIKAGDNWEEAFWLFGEIIYEYIHENDNLEISRDLQTSKAFVEAGIYILRHDGTYMVIDAGRNGQLGFGGHAHNDIFSFEYFSGNKTWIVDPGTFVYTSDYDLRQLFRSTAYHNTVQLSEHEQNVINAKHPFRMESDAMIEIIDWDVNDDYILFCGEHDGYRRLQRDIKHRRYFFFDKDTNVLIIYDLLNGSSKVRRLNAYSHLHLSPNLVPIPSKVNVGEIHISGNNQERVNIRILEPEGFELKIGDTWVSPSYGQKVDAKTLVWSWRKQSLSSIASYSLSDLRLLDSRIDNALDKFIQLIQYESNC